MHTASGQRCFLNSNKCDLATDSLDMISDGSYTLLIKATEVNDDTLFHRRLAEQRSLLAPVDSGFSWSEMLRFKPLKIESGGTFKVCFCDSELLRPGETCSEVQHFNVEVGKLHSSGISCLLTQKKLQRVSCVVQHHLGWRCYGTYTAPEPTPPLFEQTSYTRKDAVEKAKLDTWCMLGPEEQTKDDKRCQASSGFHSTY